MLRYVETQVYAESVKTGKTPKRVFSTAQFRFGFSFSQKIPQKPQLD